MIQSFICYRYLGRVNVTQLAFPNSGVQSPLSRRDRSSCGEHDHGLDPIHRLTWLQWMTIHHHAAY